MLGTTQKMKMNECKKRPNKWITSTHAHKQKDDKQSSWKGSDD